MIHSSVPPSLGIKRPCGVRVSPSTWASIPFKPITLGAVHTYPLVSRKSKVSISRLCKASRGERLAHKISRFSPPNVLAAEDLRQLLGRHFRGARKTAREPSCGESGGHVIKVGLGPVPDRSDEKRGFVTRKSP